MTDSPHMTIPQTAVYMGRSRAHIYRLIAAGDLPSSMDGRRTVHRSDADAYLKARRQVGTQVGAA